MGTARQCCALVHVKAMVAPHGTPGAFTAMAIAERAYLPVSP